MSSSTSIIERVRVYGRMIKFSHTVFALPFALSAVILALRQHPFQMKVFFFILVAMASARSAAMGFNRIVDAVLDGRNPRTARREIPAGQLSQKSAFFFVGLCSLIFIFSAFMIGTLCFYLAFPVLALLFLYSYTKRFTWLCHIYLGMTISMAPLGAWIAMTNSFSHSILWLCLALMTHIAGFDILYACQDIAFDREEGLFSIPAQLGIDRALKISTGLHILSILFFLMLALAFELSYIYLICVGIIGVLLIIEHQLVKPNDLSQVHVAFFHINSVISVLVFLGIFFDEVILKW